MAQGRSCRSGFCQKVFCRIGRFFLWRGGVSDFYHNHIVILQRSVDRSQFRNSQRGNRSLWNRTFAQHFVCVDLQRRVYSTMINSVDCRVSTTFRSVLRKSKSQEWHRCNNRISNKMFSSGWDWGLAPQMSIKLWSLWCKGQLPVFN